MTTNTEAVMCVYDDEKKLVAVIKRDETTGHKLVYMAKEASVEQIGFLISPLIETDV